MRSLPGVVLFCRLRGLGPESGDRGGFEEKGRRSKPSKGFSLIELIVSISVLSLAMLGIIATWRLSDDCELGARLDERAARILEEFSELQSFAPDFLAGQSNTASRLNFETEGIPLSPGETRTGFLYHPRHQMELNGQRNAIPTFDDAVPYQITLRSETEAQLITISYQLPFLPDSKARVTKQIRLNLRQP